MTPSLPEPGAVIRYAYLWTDEHRRGRDEGRKDRPALVLTLSVVLEDKSARVLALAITHTAPKHATDAIAIPAAVKRHLGLDSAPSWIVTTEANAFVWPGPDIRRIPNRVPATFVYGRIPGPLLQRIALSFLASRARQRGEIVSRSP